MLIDLQQSLKNRLTMWRLEQRVNTNSQIYDSGVDFFLTDEK